eukprot:NODE_911_length_3104_cov_0.287188.p3 type:complete len:155 gc:universal NODE_911_length_3104_cov_0.287188:2490-2026(-)
MEDWNISDLKYAIYIINTSMISLGLLNMFQYSCFRALNIISSLFLISVGIYGNYKMRQYKLIYVLCRLKWMMIGFILMNLVGLVLILNGMECEMNQQFGEGLMRFIGLTGLFGYGMTLYKQCVVEYHSQLSWLMKSDDTINEKCSNLSQETLNM